MTFTVYEADKPAIIGLGPRWRNATFDTKRDAEVYAYCWAYPVTKEFAEKNAPEMTPGEDYDYGMYEVPVWMRIEENS